MADEPLVDRLGNLTVLEALELARQLEAKWQIEYQSRYPLIWDPAPPDDDPYRGLRYDVTLTAAGSNVLEAIKALREAIEIGVSDAKDLVEHLPRPIAGKVKHDEAARIERILGAVGATVVIVQLPGT